MNVFFMLIFFLVGNPLASTNANVLTLNKAHEKVLFGFQLQKNHKIMTVSVAEDESYIVYRFGTKEKIELEFPREKENSWKNFKYSHYQRPLQRGVEGLVLDYLSFETNGFTYKIFQEFSESNESSEYSEPSYSSSTQYGIRISNNKSKQVVELLGDPKSVIGSLDDLRYNDKIIQAD